MESVILAGGCFWGVEAYFKRLKGVLKTSVGYTGGHIENPTYRQVCTGATCHTEACEVIYDETVLSFEKILTHLFKIIDPTSLNKQGNDVGTQYRTGIYVSTNEMLSRANLFIESHQSQYEQPIVVEVKLAQPYYLAEEYHQDYLTANPYGYCHINLALMNQEDLKPEYQRSN